MFKEKNKILLTIKIRKFKKIAKMTRTPKNGQQSVSAKEGTCQEGGFLL